MAEVDTDTGTERISRTLALDATGPQVRESARSAARWLDGGRARGRSPARAPALRAALIEGVVARWDLLLAAHRRRTLLDAAADALDAMGEGADGGVLAEWLAAGADEPPPVGRAEAFVLQWRSRSLRPSGSASSVAQPLARVLPIAGS